MVCAGESDTRPGLACISLTTLLRSSSRSSAVSLTPDIVCRGLSGGPVARGGAPLFIFPPSKKTPLLPAGLVREHLRVLAHSAIRLRAHPVHAVEPASKVRTLGERGDAKIARF